MRTTDRAAWKAACAVAESLRLRRAHKCRVMLRRVGDLIGAVAELPRLYHFLHLCDKRGWAAGRRGVVNRLIRLRETTGEQLKIVAASMENDSPHRCDPSTVMRELRQIDDDFDGWSYDVRRSVLAVATEPITLEDVALGPFEVQLRLDALADVDQSRAYHVVALEPNSATENSDITHPHVSDQNLCEGDGTLAIRSALDAGRLADFFMIVRSVLRTYNADSAYVPLDRWSDGVSCADCDAWVSEDYATYCERCGSALCDGCTVCCTCCDYAYCGDCVSRCAACDDSTCSGCTATCSGCGDRVCDDCRQDGLCPSCQPQPQDQQENPTHETTHIPAGGRSAGEQADSATIPATAATS